MKIDISKNFSSSGKDIYIIRDEYTIMEDAKNILNTYYGSRFFNREFGVDLLDYLFSPISNGVLMIIKKIIRETIINNIKEVLDVAIDIKIIDEKLDIKLILKTSKKDIETETRFYLR